MLRAILFTLSYFLFTFSATAGKEVVKANLTHMDGTTIERDVVVPFRGGEVYHRGVQMKGVYYEENGKKVKVTPKEFKRIQLFAGTDTVIFHSADFDIDGNFKPDFIHVVVDGPIMIGREHNAESSNRPFWFNVLIKDVSGENAFRIFRESDFDEIMGFLPSCEAAEAALQRGFFEYNTVEAFGRYYNKNCSW